MKLTISNLRFPIERSDMTQQRIKGIIRGFTIIELLIAIIIIGILVAIIIPRLATRSEIARQRAAQSDMEHIRDAEERAGIDTDYYYRLYVLDDNPGGDGFGTGNANDINDGVRDEASNEIAQNPTRLFIRTSGEYSGEFYSDASCTQIYRRLIADETSFGWNGRYITWQKDFNENDIPDDPWGHDYLFFTRAGLILEPDGEITVTCSIDTDGNIVAGGEYDCKRFDRFTLLSLGPDGLPGSGTGTNFGTGDDIIEQW